MPALGDHIKVEIDEIEKPARAYMLAMDQHQPKKSKNIKYATDNNNAIKT